jgi:hypothetical protein
MNRINRVQTMVQSMTIPAAMVTFMDQVTIAGLRALHCAQWKDQRRVFVD